jgi:hypothetical protein
VIGREEHEIHVAPQSVTVAGFRGNHLDLVWLAALEPGVDGEQLLDPRRNILWRNETGRSHRLEMALAGPVGEASEVVGMAVTDQSCRHRG